MKRAILLASVLSLPTFVVLAQPAGGQAPPRAYADCRDHNAGDTVLHATPGGMVEAICEATPQGLVARPQRGQGPTTGQKRPEEREGKQYSLEQASSDQAQLNTIAFNGLAFLTGDFGLDTFLPPGKVSDYFGFQYMRDIDTRSGGHNTAFLTRIANNMLAILLQDQKAKLVALAREQEDGIRLFAEKRFPLIMAFRRNLTADIPAGATGLSRLAVMAASADLYQLDGNLSYRRAEVLAGILLGLDTAQKNALAKLKFGDSGTWPDLPDQINRRGISHEIDVAMMTYASEMFSWYAGSLEADTYFCPERHGMYFGGFGMKTAPAMSKKDFSISTALTGNAGQAFLDVLDDGQRRNVTALVDQQRPNLTEIVGIRRIIATELRRFLEGETADREKIMELSRRYGELDGEMSYLYATAFAKVGETLTARQRQNLHRLRATNSSDPKGPFLYSTPISMPNVENTDRFFGPGK